MARGNCACATQLLTYQASCACPAAGPPLPQRSQVLTLFLFSSASQRLRAKSISCLVTSIRVLPYFLVSGTHMEHDLPRVLHDIYLQYKGLSIIATLPLDTHPGLLPILTDGARGPQ